MSDNSDSDSDTVVSGNTAVGTTVNNDESANENENDDDDELWEMHRHGGNYWFYDDFPCSGPAFNELSQEDKEMVNWAITRKSVVVKDITYYVYCKNMASWWQMESPTASQELSEVAGINAPVNYAAALRRFYPLLTRVAYSIGQLSRSFCIGTYRLVFKVEYSDEGPIISYRPHKTVIENDRGHEHTRMYMFVTCPIIMPFPFMCPARTVIDMESEILNKIMLPLRDDQKLDFLWRIGNALIDPIRNPSVIIFYGPTGEEGKSALALNISRVLGTGAKWTVTDLIGKASKWPDADTVMELAEKRVIICDECGIEEDFNYNNIKRWTSNAPVQAKGVSAYLSQTIIGISNKIGFAKKAGINNSVGRRVVMYKLSKRLGKLEAFPAGAITSHVRLQMMALAKMVSDAYQRAPMSLEIALYTTFRKSVNFVTAGLIIDPAATPEQCREATAAMSLRVGVQVNVLVESFAAMSSRLVCEPRHEMPFIVGMRCTKYNLTQTGREYVAKNWGKETLDLETLVTTVKII